MNQGMKKHVMRAAACFAAGTMTIAGCSAAVSAAGVGLAGLDQAAVWTEAPAEPKTAQAEEKAQAETSEETQTEAAENVVNTLAVAQIGDDSYINIRSAADENSEIVGKLYNNNAATILADAGEWYLVQSGNCEGYVAKYLMTTGSAAQAVISDIATPVAQVNAEALMVRAEASEDAEVIDMVTADQIVYLNEDLGGWAKVSTDNGTGYVNAAYVSYATYLPQAESVEEEAARIAAEEAAYEAWLAEQERLYEEEMARQQAEWEAQNQAWIEYLQSQGDYADQAQAEADQQQANADYLQQEADNAAANGDWDYAAQAQAEADAAAQAAAQAQAEADAANQQALDNATQALENAGIDADSVVSDDSSYSRRQQIVDYALQFVGNPYVWGGTSLTNGADCSGFTQSVMGNNGISINRTAGAQSQGGTSVALSDIQPGDLLFYSGSGDYGIGHVSMYIGNGQVVHASNSRDGIIVSDVNYRTPVSAKSYID